MRPFKISVCFQIHLRVGGVHWYLHRNSPFPQSLSPQRFGEDEWLIIDTPGSPWGRGWRGPREETLGVQKETGDILRKSQAEPTAL